MWLSGAALCTVLCRGAVFSCTLLHCPSRTMLCFLLGCCGWASWWAQTQVCDDDAVVVEGKSQSVDALPPSRRSVPLFGWLVFSISIFAGWPSWGASRPDGKDSLKFRGESSNKLMNKHTYFWVPALCPSKSGLINKHIVKQ